MNIPRGTRRCILRLDRGRLSLHETSGGREVLERALEQAATGTEAPAFEVVFKFDGAKLAIYQPFVALPDTCCCGENFKVHNTLEEVTAMLERYQSHVCPHTKNNLESEGDPNPNA